MATFNGERYLSEQLDSLANQTTLPLELVVCDDCSNDSTIAILKKFSDRMPFPVRIQVNQQNLGFSDNFLQAASLCSGDWIAFCDQDDVWMPDKLKRIEESIQRYGSEKLVLVGHTALLTNQKLETTGQRLPDFKHDGYVKRQSNYGFFCIVGFAMAFHARLIREFDSALRPRIYRQQSWTPPGHDQWIGMLSNAVGDIAYISEPLAYWRRSEGSLTRPPEPQSIAQEASVSKRALYPKPYVLLGDMAKEAAESLEKLSAINDNPIDKASLMSASMLFRRLAENLHYRASLYSQTAVFDRMRSYAKLLFTNAYAGPGFCSLGWRAALKDAAFSFGLIRKGEAE